MRYRHSLRFRILMAFVFSGVILGPLLALVFLTVAYELEELSVEQALTERLGRVMTAPEQFALREAPDAPAVRILGHVPLSALPRDILSAGPGLYEYEPGEGLEFEGEIATKTAGNATDDGSGHSWYIAVGARAEKRYVVFEDVTALEYRETLALWVVGGGTVLAVYLALWLGYYLSRRLLAPVTQLAEAVSNADAHTADRPLAPDYASDEIGRLADALDRYRDRMRDALDRERAFSADASHELRNPLAVVQSAAEIIECDPAVRGATRRAATRMREAAIEMGETVTALLLLMREPSRHTQDEAVDIAAIVERLVAQYVAEAAPGVAVQWHGEANPSVRAPAVAVQSIAANLIRNAVQNTRAGRVDVYLRQDRLTVEDTGVGIPAAELPHVKKRGARGQSALTSGNGLGLSIISRLCERFGWVLTLESTTDVGTQAEWRFGADS